MERGSPSSFLFYGLPFSDLLVELSIIRFFFFFKKFVYDAYLAIKIHRIPFT